MLDLKLRWSRIETGPLLIQSNDSQLWLIFTVPYYFLFFQIIKFFLPIFSDENSDVYVKLSTWIKNFNESSFVANFIFNKIFATHFFRFPCHQSFGIELNWTGPTFQPFLERLASFRAPGLTAKDGDIWCWKFELVINLDAEVGTYEHRNPCSFV